MSHARRVAAGIVAGGSVPLSVILFTVLAEDRPLWGINPDVQLWAAGVLSALAGLGVHLWRGARSPAGLAQGALFGLLGFGIVLATIVGAVAVLDGFGAGAAYYQGWEVRTDFDEEWNATIAREALEAQGFEVTDVSGEDLRGDAEDVTIWLHVSGDRSASSEQGFTLLVSFQNDGEQADGVQEARAQAEQARPALEERFRDVLESFEGSTGWQHVGEPRWEPLIAVT